MVLQVLSEPGQRRMQAIFTGAQQMMIGPPASFPARGIPGARGPFVTIDNALRNGVFGYLYTEIITILGMEGIAVGSELARAIESFAWEKTKELEKGAREIRLGALVSDDKSAYEEKRRYQLGDTATPPPEYNTGMTPQALRKAYKPFGLIAEKTGHKIRTVFFSLLLLVVGILVSAIVGNMWYMVGFIFMSLYTILPDPTENEMTEETGWAGNLFATRENRTNTGIAFLKAVFRVGMVICFVGGLYIQPFPMSNLILLLLAFGFYFTMPIEFEPRKPYEFILSFFRVLLGLFIAFFIFGVGPAAGIFQAPELGWLTLAFFIVLPVATEKRNLARALGALGKGSGESYEMFDKIIFLIIMVIFATFYGFSFVGGFFSGTGGIVFSAVWIIGLIAGLTTPAETRPWMGVIILIIGFVVFGLGTGQQAMGVAFFGEWWPSVHNTVTDFMKPMGDMFGTFQNTFGQSWLLFTNPVGYAQQITQGTYAQNELGTAGAYGLEIRKFDVQSIYINEPFMIQVELENKGIFHAKDVVVDIYTSKKSFKMGTESNSIALDMVQAQSEEIKSLGVVVDADKPWYKYTISTANSQNNLKDIEPKDMVPIFLFGKMSCADFGSTAWTDFPLGKEHTVREYFIPFIVKVTYKYESSSNLQVDFISNEEWKRLSTDNKLVRATKPSLISTSPASLNLGSMDQPIKEDTPFYVGFNLTSTWAKGTQISDGMVNLILPYAFGNPTCIPTTEKKNPVSNKIEGNAPNQVYNLTFNLETDSKYSVCNYRDLAEFSGLGKTMNVPKKTYTITAYATYKFSKWESKDTQFNFKDVCWPQKDAINVTSPKP